MSMTKSASQYFEKVAGAWDDIRAGYFTGAVRQAAINKAYLRPEMVVADVGAGTGFMSAGLAPLVSKVFVLDGSAAMLKVARKNLLEWQDKLEYHLAESLSLPLPDVSVDAVFANMYLHHCTQPAKAIEEMVRILKPGGRLVITDMDSHPYAWLKEEMADEWMGFERAQMRAWFAGANLVNIVTDCTGQSCCATSQNPDIGDAQGRQAKISVFVAAGTRRINMRADVETAYALTAQTSGGCSCNTDPSNSQQSCCSKSTEDLVAQIELTSYYSSEEKAGVPAEAAEFSLGCGNPIAMANLRPAEVVLDIGSGGGLDAFLAARRVGPTGKVIGVDMTPAMLDRARRAARKAAIKNVEFRAGQAEYLPLPDSSVDVVLSNCVINLCEDKGRVFNEAYRVLKPGGRLEVSDVVSSSALPASVRQNAATWAACAAGALSEAEYLDLISQAGFKTATVRRSDPTDSLEGVSLYSVIVSAQKAELSSVSSSCCG